ncbi:hypothetical protein Hanom_Chr09g00810491 [Helianthus anomalus]
MTPNSRALPSPSSIETCLFHHQVDRCHNYIKHRSIMLEVRLSVYLILFIYALDYNYYYYYYYYFYSHRYHKKSICNHY